MAWHRTKFPLKHLVLASVNAQTEKKKHKSQICIILALGQNFSRIFLFTKINI